MGLKTLAQRPALVWFLLATGLALAFFHALGAVPLFDLDEGAFGAATFEMLARGDYLTTYLNGELRFDKPILIYWLQAGSVTLFGLNEWALRLPSALAATLWALALFVFVRPRLGQTAGLMAALSLAFALVSWVIGRAATADALLNLWLTLALLDSYRYWERPRREMAWRVYLWLGLGLLTKGPVAVVIPLAVTAPFFFSTQRGRDWLRAVFNPIGWLLFALVALPWYWLEYQAQGQAFIDGFLLKHNVGRFTSTMERHGGSIFYYFPVVLAILLPFAGLFIRTLGQLPRLRHDPLDRFLWLWFGFVFLFFSLSSTQLPHYLLYGGSALFILMARYRATLDNRWLAFLPALLLFALLPALPEISAWLGERSDDAYLTAMLGRASAVADLDYRLWTTAGLLAVLGIALWRRLPPWQGLLIVGAVQVTVLGQAVLPWAGAVQQQPLREAALLAKDLDIPVVMSGVNMPSFTVYRQAVTPRRAPQPGEAVITRVHKMGQWPTAEVLYQKGGIVLLRLPTQSPPSHPVAAKWRRDQ